ncbi:MAG: aminotransferase class V-fold PLP-dependent enzyme [Anaerovoracaceae bacterium]
MIYLDNGATSFPKPKVMVSAMNLCMIKYCGNPGRSGHDMSMRTGEEVYKARKVLTEFFNMEKPDQIIFTANCTEALNLGIKGILSPGDHVITTAMEHNSVLRPIVALEEKGIIHTILPCREDGTLDPKLVRLAIRENTKLIVCTHAANVTGTIMPLKEIGKIARENEILFMVDGAQGAGHLPLDVKELGIDLFAAPGHKGLMGPMGTGFLYLGKDICLNPIMEGGTGTASKELVQPMELPEGFEVGTVNAPGIAGLRASTEYVDSIGVGTIETYESGLISILDQALRNMGGLQVYGPLERGKKAGITAFNIRGKSCEEVAERLNKDWQIAVRGGYHCAGLAHKTIGTWDQGAVRISVSPYNTKKQIKTAIEAVYKISMD